MDLLKKWCLDLEKELEERLGLVLKTHQRDAIRNCGSLMMYEALYLDLARVESPEDLEAELPEGLFKERLELVVQGYLQDLARHMSRRLEADEVAFFGSFSNIIELTDAFGIVYTSKDPEAALKDAMSV